MGSDRHEVKPWPIFGGEPRGNSGTQIKKAATQEWKSVREPAAIEEDIAKGYIACEAARRFYGA